MLGNLTKFGVIPRGLWNTVSYGPFLIYFTTRHAALGIKFGEIAAWVLARHAASGLNEGMTATTQALRHAIIQDWFKLGEYLSINNAVFSATSVTFDLNVLAAIPYEVDELAITIDDWTTSQSLTDVTVGAHSITFSTASEMWSIVAKVVPKRSGVQVGNEVSAELSYYTYQSGDPYWASVVFLAGFDSGVIADEGPNARAMAIKGTVTFDNANAFLGSPYALGVNIGEATDGYARVTTNKTDFRFGTAPFTIEGFAKAETLASSGSRAMLANITNFVDYTAWTLEHTAAGKLVFRTLHFDTAYKFTLTSSGARAAGVPFHFAITRDASNYLRLFIDGVLDTTLNIGTISVAGTYDDYPLQIGDSTINNPFKGWLDEVRITKGVCRYTADFTVPTIPYPRGA